MTFLRAAFLTIAGLSLLSSARAQSVFGEIRGTVTDPSGSVIAGASVTATNTGTNESRKVVTDHAGDYSVLNLDAGMYEVLIEQGGFRKTLTKDVIVRAREVARIDAHLEIQGTATEVLVTGVAQVITTDQATIVDSKSSEQIQNLPVNFRAGAPTPFSMRSRPRPACSLAAAEPSFHYRAPCHLWRVRQWTASLPSASDRTD